MKRQLFRQHAVGKAGEYRVASELILLGLHPAFPSIDLGYDLMVEHGVRIQVKSVQRRTKLGHANVLSYRIFPSKRLTYDGNRLIDRRDRKISDECDFVVVWGMEEDRFWVIPSHLLDGKQMVSLGPDCYFQETDVKQIEALRSQGKSYNAIASELGISQTMVWALVTGKRDGSDRYPELREIRACEDRWDYITQHVADLNTPAGKWQELGKVLEEVEAVGTPVTAS